jgi:hypothetical protein
MPVRDDARILLQLAAARSAIDAAIAMLAPQQIELPEGFELPAPTEGTCLHPADRRRKHSYGGHWTCLDCGYHE